MLLRNQSAHGLRLALAGLLIVGMAGLSGCGDDQAGTITMGPAGKAAIDDPFGSAKPETDKKPARGGEVVGKSIKDRARGAAD